MIFLRTLILVAAVVCGSLQTTSLTARCEAYFSPEDHISGHLLDLINAEEKSIRIAIYGFTHYKIATALIAAKKRGVAVEILVDPFSLGMRSQTKRLVDGGISVFVFSPKDVPDNKHPLLHDKFCIFGDQLLWTGSFNFTYSADTQHQENVILLDDKEVVQRFLKQFKAIKKNECVSYEAYKKRGR